MTMTRPVAQANNPALIPSRHRCESATADKRGTPEHRVHSRHNVAVELTLESDHNFYTGFTENISTGGLFISTRDLLPIGSTFQIHLSLPNMADCSIDCEVRWQRLEQLDNPESCPGMGVRFINLDERTSAAINAFIKERDTLFYDDE